MSVAIQVNSAASRDGTRLTSRRKVALWLVYILAIVLFAGLLVDGYSYYSTPYLERPHHPEYRQLRPAGSRGLAYGITGATMMVLMLAYTLRKRTRLFGRRLPLRPFLDFHIFMGIFGPLFILLHTSFKIQGLVAIAFWSMAAVALSGYFGRYLYQQIPRSAEDHELSLQEIEGLRQQISNNLARRGQLPPETIQAINRIFDREFGTPATGKSVTLPGMIAADLKRPWVRSRLRRQFRRLVHLPRRDREALFSLAAEQALLRRRLAALDRIQHLFHYWHVIHKPFAIIMYIIMFVHIGVAIWTGYGWF